ncbi:MAG TPA: hypothetical protein PLY45_00550 [bacterium]|nr:hypothetical protein [bacterium]
MTAGIDAPSMVATSPGGCHGYSESDSHETRSEPPAAFSEDERRSNTSPPADVVEDRNSKGFSRTEAEAGTAAAITSAKIGSIVFIL